MALVCRPHNGLFLKVSAMLSAGEIDDIMMKSPQGVEVALHHAKMWSKYAKDLASYIEKHSSLGKISFILCT